MAATWRPLPQPVPSPEHPAAPETHRRGQGFAVAGGIGGGFGIRVNCLVVIAVIVIVRNTCDGLPALADAVERGKMVLWA